MNRCLCIKTDGQQCSRNVSLKHGHNQQFCWQHQNCKKIQGQATDKYLQSAQKPLKSTQKPLPLKSTQKPLKPNLDPIATALKNLVEPFSNLDIKTQDEALKKFGDHPGKVYIIIPDGMGAFYVMRRSQIDQQPQVYLSYDEHYINYAIAKQFVKGYLPVDLEEGAFLLDY